MIRCVNDELKKMMSRDFIGNDGFGITQKCRDYLHARAGLSSAAYVGRLEHSNLLRGSRSDGLLDLAIHPAYDSAVITTEDAWTATTTLTVPGIWSCC